MDYPWLLTDSWANKKKMKGQKRKWTKKKQENKQIKWYLVLKSKKKNPIKDKRLVPGRS